MAGSHRAPVSARRRRVSPRILVVLLLIVAVPALVYALTRSGGTDPGTPAGEPTTHVSIGTSAPPTPTSTPTKSKSPTPTPTQTAKPLPRVNPSAPRRLLVPGVLDIGFDSVVAPRDGVFSAASTAEAARWGGRGVPGSPASDTVYLIGKVSARGAFAQLTALHRGARITLRTHTGVLTYTVQAVAERPANGLTSNAEFKRGVVGRLQLVGIRYSSTGDRTGKILLVTAQLTGARRT